MDPGDYRPASGHSSPSRSASVSPLSAVFRTPSWLPSSPVSTADVGLRLGQLASLGSSLWRRCRSRSLPPCRRPWLPYGRTLSQTSCRYRLRLHCWIQRTMRRRSRRSDRCHCCYCFLETTTRHSPPSPDSTAGPPMTDSTSSPTHPTRSSISTAFSYCSGH